MLKGGCVCVCVCACMRACVYVCMRVSLTMCSGPLKFYFGDVCNRAHAIPYLLRPELLWSRQILAIIVPQVIVADNGGGLETG